MRAVRLAVRSGAIVAMVLTSGGSPGVAADLEYLRSLRLPAQGDRISYPSSVVADLETGEVFVCDPRRNRILIFDDEGLFEFELYGGNTFRSPSDLAVDSEGFLLVVALYEEHRAILELDFDGLLLGEIRLQGLPDWVEQTHFISVALSASGENLYVLDQRNLTVWISDRRGNVRGSIDLAADLTDDQRSETQVSHVDVYADRVLVAMPRVGTVRAYDLDGTLLSSVGQFGTGTCELLFPIAAAEDASGEYLVVDRHRMVISAWDVAADRCLGDYYGFGVTPGYLYFPSDLALDATGQVYVSQPFQGRVQVYRWSSPAARRP